MRTIKRDIVGAFIFSSDEKLLVGKSRKGGVYENAWIIPGGGVDEGESRRDALNREVLEETGIDITEAKVEPIAGASNGSSKKRLRESGELVNVQMTFYDFSVKLAKPAGEILAKAEDDLRDLQWVPIAELQKLALASPTRATLSKLGLLPRD